MVTSSTILYSKICKIHNENSALKGQRTSVLFAQMPFTNYGRKHSSRDSSCEGDMLNETSILMPDMICYKKQLDYLKLISGSSWGWIPGLLLQRSHNTTAVNWILCVDEMSKMPNTQISHVKSKRIIKLYLESGACQPLHSCFWMCMHVFWGQRELRGELPLCAWALPSLGCTVLRNLIR